MTTGVRAGDVEVASSPATRTLVDPFYGWAPCSRPPTANQHGPDAVGVELSAKRAENARQLQLKPRID